MKIGTRVQYEHILKSLAGKPARLEELEKKIVWVNDLLWYIPEAKDGDKERQLIEKLKNTSITRESAVPVVQFAGESGASVRHTHKFAIEPPHKKPPPFLSKVAQYLMTVTGPKVTEEVFQARFRKCTHEGGCTFSTVDGIVEEIGKNFVRVGSVMVLLPADETPSVQLGQHVQHGQTIATSETSKPCPMLNVENKGNEPQYFCGGCGCGARKAAELRNKLYYVRVTCPRTPPQFTAEDENGPNVAK